MKFVNFNDKIYTGTGWKADVSYFILFYISVPSLVSKQSQEGKYGAEHTFTFNNIVKSCLQTQNYTHIMGKDRQKQGAFPMFLQYHSFTSWTFNNHAGYPYTVS